MRGSQDAKYPAFGSTSSSTHQSPLSRPALSPFQEVPVWDNTHLLLPTNCQLRPNQDIRNPFVPNFLHRATPSRTCGPTRLPSRTEQPLLRQPFWGSGQPRRQPASASQAKPSRRLWLPQPRTQRAEAPGEGGVHSHCVVCNTGHRRCRRGPHWRFCAIRWWLLSDNLHNRCPLSWRPTGRRGAASAGWAPTPHLDLPPRPQHCPSTPTT
jgi:hypothetical protein